MLFKSSLDSTRKWQVIHFPAAQVPRVNNKQLKRCRLNSQGRLQLKPLRTTQIWIPSGGVFAVSVAARGHFRESAKPQKNFKKFETHRILLYLGISIDASLSLAHSLLVLCTHQNRPFSFSRQKGLSFQSWWLGFLRLPHQNVAGNSFFPLWNLLFLSATNLHALHGLIYFVYFFFFKG